MEGSTVYVINKEPNRRTYKFAGRSYILEPDEKVPVPFEAATLWFGDPRAAQDIMSVRDADSDVVSWVPDRDSELRRLTVRYGGDDHAKFPEVEIQDLEGNVLHSVIEDPEGEHVLPAVTTLSESQLKDKKIDDLMARLERMEAMLTGNSGQVEQPLTEEPVDLPPVTESSGDSGNADAAEGIPDADETPGTKPKGRTIK